MGVIIVVYRPAGPKRADTYHKDLVIIEDNGTGTIIQNGPENQGPS